MALGICLNTYFLKYSQKAGLALKTPPDAPIIMYSSLLKSFLAIAIADCPSSFPASRSILIAILSPLSAAEKLF